MNADVLLFAIRGALYLGDQARLAYVNSTKRRALVLPLPDFDRDPSVSAAVDFFCRTQYTSPPQLVDLLQKIQRQAALTADEKKHLIEYHNEELARATFKEEHLRNLDDGTSISLDSVNALVTITQWQRGADPNPTVLQSVAGSLLDVAVDYFVQIPDSLQENSRKGRALSSFFAALDGFSFAEAPVREIPRKLMLSVLEVVDANPDLLVSNSRYQEIIAATTRGLLIDLGARLKNVQDDLTRIERLESWGETVFRSVLWGAGELILSDAGKFVGIGDAGKQALVERTGRAILGMVDAAPEGRLEAVFSGSNLEQLTDTVLLVLSENPDLLTDDDSRLRPLISRAAADIASIDALDNKGLVPELVRLVVAATAENAHLIWPTDDDDPTHNLALIAAKSVILAVTAPPAAGSTWKVRFSDADVASLTETVLHELAWSPGWLKSESDGRNNTLDTVLGGMFGVLRKRGQNLLGKETGLRILQTSLRSVARRSELGQKLGNGDVMVSAVVAAILTQTYDTGNTRALWQLARQEALQTIVDIAFEEISSLDFRSTTPDTVVEILTLVLKAHVARTQEGDAWNSERFALDLGARLEEGG